MQAILKKINWTSKKDKVIGRFENYQYNYPWIEIMKQGDLWWWFIWEDDDPPTEAGIAHSEEGAKESAIEVLMDITRNIINHELRFYDVEGDIEIVKD